MINYLLLRNKFLTFVTVHSVRMHIFLFAQLSHTNYHLEQELTSNPKYKELRPHTVQASPFVFRGCGRPVWENGVGLCRFCIYMQSIAR